MQLNPGQQITSELNNYAALPTSSRYPYCNCNKPRNIQSIFEPSVYNKPNNITNMFFTHLDDDKQGLQSIKCCGLALLKAYGTKSTIPADAGGHGSGWGSNIIMPPTHQGILRASRVCNLRRTQRLSRCSKLGSSIIKHPLGEWDGKRQIGDGGHQRCERCRNTKEKMKDE